MYLPDVIPEADRATMVEKGQYGDSVGFGESIAVINVDMTNEFVEDKYPNGFAETGKPAVAAINRLMAAARAADVTGFYSRSLKGSHPCEIGRWGDTSSKAGPETEEMTALAHDLDLDESDVVFDKYKPSVFFGTQLESMLNYEGIDTVIVTGMTTSGCVRATVIDAFSLNYRVIVPQECVADRSQISHEINLFDMDMKYADVMHLDDVIAELDSLAARSTRSAV